MEWLNYHHLHYFWAVMQEGSVAAAGRRLRVSSGTVSEQVRSLEGTLGGPLFARAGRGLAPTELGHTTFRYADEIFGLGRSLLAEARGRDGGRPAPLTVGLSDTVPKMVALQLLLPVLEMEGAPHLVCRGGQQERMLAELASHAVDVVLSDAPVHPGWSVTAYNHQLGDSPMVVMGTAALVRPRRADFPRSLDGAPMLLPLAGTPARRSFDGWCDAEGVRPEVRAEFEDSALLKTFGRRGFGLFLVPAVAVDAVRAPFEVETLGEVPGLREHFYAITVERRVRHPAVRLLCASARKRLATL